MRQRSIKQILMTRDDLSEESAQESIDEAREDFNYYLSEGDLKSAYNICQEHFGLEPDYLDEFM